MPVVTQPAGLSSGSGCVLTVGIRVNGDRTAIVLPVATDDDSLLPKNLCEDAVAAFAANALATLLDCLSVDAWVSFIQAEGMDTGFTPSRLDYGSTDKPGTGGVTCETSQVAALIVFYAEFDDLPPNARMRVGKNFIPGVADGDVGGDAISAGLLGHLDDFADKIANGYAGVATPSKKWYRVIAAPPVLAGNVQDLDRVGVYQVRGYTGTQRRRLIPH